MTHKNQETVTVEVDGADPFDHLDPETAQILQKQIELNTSKISFRDFYRYATFTDKVLISLGSLAAIGAGAGIPMFTIVFGGLTNKFNDFETNSSGDTSWFQSTVNQYTLYFLYLGIGIMTLAFLHTWLFINAGEILTARIRQHYLRAILRQNIGYFDKLGAGEVTTRISSDTNAIQVGISEKFALILSSISSFVTSFVIAFAESWKLTLILLASVFVIAGAITVGSTFVFVYDAKFKQEYAAAGTIAEESLSAIRNTLAFGIQNRMAVKFHTVLKKAQHHALTRDYGYDSAVGFLWSCSYYTYALAFWQGSRMVVWGDINVGSLVTVVTAVILGSFAVANAAPSLQAAGQAIASGAKIFEAIDRIPPIDCMSDAGVVLDRVEGKIEINDVSFIYPSRPDVTVLENMSLMIEPGQTVALVGVSGSGKSTIVGLLERFYDPIKGIIKIDGIDITKMNIRWLRQQLALVSQEPTLFSVSIYENICFGLLGTVHENASEEKKRELVIEACKQANAWDFIQNMEEGLETNVGERGFLISGGQKQRIAIARAIISNPKILLLDEATSALDTKSEWIVQDALDRAAKSRTTIVIAHRLSTIKDADKIVVMSRGKIIESGTHTELLERQGLYYRYVDAQNLHKELDIQSGPMSSTTSVSGAGHTTVEPEKFDYDDIKLEQIKSSQIASSEKATVDDEKVHNLRTTATHVRKHSFIDPLLMLYKFTSEHTITLLVGSILACIGGFGYPALALIYGKIIGAIMVKPDQYPEMRHHVNIYTGYFFMVGVLLCFLLAIRMIIMSIVSANQMRNIRLALFKHYMSMDISFFDRDSNGSGALTTQLAKGPLDVDGLSPATLGQLQQSIVCLFGSIIVSIAYCWRLGLVGLACVPILVGTGFYRIFVLTKLQERSVIVYDKSASYACESVAAIRTVAALTRENGVLEEYTLAVNAQVQRSRFSVLKNSLLYGFSTGASPWVMGLGFWYGASLIGKGTISPGVFFVSFMAIVFGSEAAGTIFSYSPDIGRAYQSAKQLAGVFLEKPTMMNNDGIEIDNLEGHVEFVDVHFKYPTRPDVSVLRGLNLKVRKGEYVALVGASGCGKSTTISLIESFYQPLKGTILLDDKYDLNTLQPSSLRQHIALVQQEPILYSASIAENIKLGSPNENVSDDEMIAAAKMANIHQFIESLPDGYNTYCGSKGSLLSGGQKQRIAIARALIRQPKILLLDEATSALDSESEKVVQRALDNAAQGRTTIAVAHRLSTIQKADKIYVIDNGKVVETGTHMQLIGKRGRYFELVQMQSLDQ